MTKAFITGLSGPELTVAERRFLASEQPAGLILFARNIVEPTQVRRLVSEALGAVGAEALMLIDQEGGRVQRLRPPHWRALPPARAFATCHAVDPARAVAAARIVSRLVASDLRALGITMNCAPVLDVPAPGAHDIIGDRAYGDDAATIVALGKAVAAGLMDGGVIPVIKHVPGHGRATADSHLALPVVDADRRALEASDFAPFKALAGMPAAMTAHVVFTAVDPSAPASTSAKVTREIIRGAIGFDGLLMSDDLSMKALTGTMAERTRAVLDAGSDLALHCNGALAEMAEVAAAAPALAGKALTRFRRALDVTAATLPFDIAAAESALAAVQAVKTVA